MKLATQMNNVESDGILRSQTFSIKAGAHIMSVLSGLYKNPIEAMVREYLTNMLDANIAFRKANPGAVVPTPELSLPTILSPYLEFCDYGIGMDYNTVMSVFTTYGESTKTNSNDEVGGFGLGSKTAFCYNSGQPWTIEARKNGEKNIFLAVIGPDGVPTLNHVSSEPTTDHSGVTIRIPILQTDFPACVSQVEKFAPYFPEPLQVNNIDTPLEKVKYLFHGTNWGLRDEKNNGYYLRIDRPQIIMGNVPYDAGSLIGDYPITNNRFDLFVNVGDVDIVPSRDALKNTPKTMDALRKVIDTVKADLKKNLQTELDSQPNEWEAMGFIKRLPSYLQGLDGTSLTYKGQPFTFKHMTIVRKSADFLTLDPSAVIEVFGRTENSGAKIDTLPNETLTVAEPRNMYNHNSYIQIYLDNGTTKKPGRVVKSILYTSLLEKGPNGRVRWGNTGYHRVGHAILISTKLNKDKVSAFFGGYPTDFIQYVKDVENTVDIRRGVDKKEAVYRFNGRTWTARVKMPVGTVEYYLPLKQTHTGRFHYVVGNDWNADRLMNVGRAWNLPGLANTLYGVKEDELNKVPSNWINSNWINLETAVVVEARRRLTADLPNLQKVYNNHKAYNIKGMYSFNRNIISFIVNNKLETVSPFDAMIDAYNKHEAQKLSAAQIVSTEGETIKSVLQQYCRGEWDKEVITTPATAPIDLDLGELQENIWKAFPLLKYYNQYNGDAASFLEYINFKRGILP